MRLVVVGGGFAGLATAVGAVERDPSLQVTLLEASSRVGGALRSEHQAGFLFEHGPISIPWPGGAMAALLQQLGLEGDLEWASPAASKRLLLHRGALQRWSLERRGLLANRVLSAAARWRAASGIRIALKPRFGPRTERSLRALLAEHLGGAAGELLGELLLLELGAADPDEVSATALFPRWGLLEARYGSLLRGSSPRGNTEPSGAPLVALRGGNEQLALALQGVLGSRVRCSSMVASVAREGQGWRLLLAGGEVLEADALVLANGPAGSAKLLEESLPELAAELAAIPNLGMTGVHLGYPRSAVPMPLDAAAIDLPRRSGRQARVVQLTSALYPSRAPADGVGLRVVFGGNGGSALSAFTDGQLLALARSEVEAVMGVVAEPLAWSVSRWPQGFPRYALDHRARVQRIRHLSTGGGARLALVGNYLSGLGLADVLHESQSAIQTLLGVLRV